MVRRASLREGGYVFVLPEQVDGIAEYPLYAKVFELSVVTATVRSLYLEEPVSCDIAIGLARSMVVTVAEATRTRHRVLLRQSVWTEAADHFWHGQAIGVDGRLAQVQLQDRVVLVEPSQLTPVAPVVALLLLSVPIASSTGVEAVADMQSTILVRILGGSAGAPASNAIPSILGMLVDAFALPTGNSARQWTEPRTGVRRTFRLQHAFDYAFVVDGSQSAPTTLRLAVGSSFCDDPLYSDRSHVANPESQATSTAHGTASPDPANSISSRFAQEEPSSPDRHATEISAFSAQATAGPPGRGTVESQAQAVPTTFRRDPAFNTEEPSLDARIMEVLLHRPELLARFVQLITNRGSPPSAPATPDSGPSRRTSKYAFAPTAVQVAVHTSITAPEHRGTAPSLFVEIVIHAVAVRFQPHPGVVIRLFGFQFGILGLSILHFAPSGIQQQMVWLNAGGCNMQNVSAGVAVPRDPAATSMGVLADCARMLCRYGREFFVQPVRDVLETLLDFLQQLDGWHPWISADLPHGSTLSSSNSGPLCMQVVMFAPQVSKLSTVYHSATASCRMLCMHYSGDQQQALQPQRTNNIGINTKWRPEIVARSARLEFPGYLRPHSVAQQSSSVSPVSISYGLPIGKFHSVRLRGPGSRSTTGIRCSSKRAYYPAYGRPQ